MYVRTVSEFECIQGGNTEDNLKARRAGGRKVTILSDAFHLHRMDIWLQFGRVQKWGIASRRFRAAAIE